MQFEPGAENEDKMMVQSQDHRRKRQPLVHLEDYSRAVGWYPGPEMKKLAHIFPQFLSKIAGKLPKSSKSGREQCCHLFPWPALDSP
jgi:hypothetical protein